MRTVTPMGKVPRGLVALLIAGLFSCLLQAERRRPLRRPGWPKARRVARNLTLAATGAMALSVASRPIVEPLSRFVERRRWGLARLPPAVGVPAAVLLLDYTLFLWHILTHRVPGLWRFHRVHHADLDLDASTGLRFHFGELVLSVAFRSAQVGLLGVGPLPLGLWQTLVLISILFHHSNVELDPELERKLSAILVTPRLHGIHHTATVEDTSSNWSSGLTLWDRLHGTLRRRGTPAAIGAPGQRSPLSLGGALADPFRALPSR